VRRSCATSPGGARARPSFVVQLPFEEKVGIRMEIRRNLPRKFGHLRERDHALTLGSSPFDGRLRFERNAVDVFAEF
jgi:hypothetical protein